MNLSPFDPDLGALAALIPPRTPEQPVQTPNEFARRLSALGRPGPYRSSPHNPGAVVDRADHIFEVICPTVQGAAARREAAEITALALNRLCGFAVIEDRLDPAHLAAVAAESARFRAQAAE